MIEVHVLQVDLDDKSKHGVNFRHIMRIMDNPITIEMTGFADPTASPGFFAGLDGSNLTGLIECLQTTTDAKTIASPRLLVVNGQESRIQIGEQLGYRVATVTETSTTEDVEFLDLGVVLSVTPRISQDGKVMMRVKPEVSSGQINPDTELPEEETTEVETDVLLKSGQGMVIGGLIQEKDINIQEKIPCLGDIWLVGKLFQRREIHKSRTEIIITLMPRVLPYDPEYAMREQGEVNRAEAPLFEGALCRSPRPWEPCLPDAIDNPKCGRFSRPRGRAVRGTHCGGR
jgi:type II secretory pathway component GspD/PulD (secretin)